MSNDDERLNELNEYLDEIEKNKPKSIEKLEEEFFATLYPSITKMKKERAETNDWGIGEDDPRTIASALYPSMRRKP